MLQYKSKFKDSEHNRLATPYDLPVTRQSKRITNALFGLEVKYRENSNKHKMRDNSKTTQQFKEQERTGSAWKNPCDKICSK